MFVLRILSSAHALLVHALGGHTAADLRREVRLAFRLAELAQDSRTDRIRWRLFGGAPVFGIPPLARGAVNFLMHGHTPGAN